MSESRDDAAQDVFILDVSLQDRQGINNNITMEFYELDNMVLDKGVHELLLNQPAQHSRWRH